MPDPTVQSLSSNIWLLILWPEVRRHWEEPDLSATSPSTESVGQAVYPSGY